ncbi:MAG: TFIIB-type zinc ribbon-containing protein [Candidatus Hermodarchaeota archaeon]|nr:TFIIB-type zinc ribbon-containing protein [Candidatus Hermodarchaeota archaeon]
MTVEYSKNSTTTVKHADVLRCPDCSSHNIVHDPTRGELICTGCGMVLSEAMIDHRAGVRAFTPEEKAERSIHGLPLSQMLPDFGLSTKVSTRMNGNGISPERAGRLERIMRWNSRSTWRRRNFTIAFTEIRRLSEKLSIPGHIRETAAIYYRKAYKHDLLRGHSIKAMVAACVFASSKTCGFPLTLDSILKTSGEEDRVIKRCYVLLVKTLDLKPKRMSLTAIVPRFANALGLSAPVEQRALEMLGAVSEKLQLSGKDPKGYVAAAIYLSAKQLGETRSQQAVATELGITEVTLRSRQREIAKVIGFN